MDKNIKYVREKQLASLLNDMVMHLLATQPPDPHDALIRFLDKRLNKNAPAKTEKESNDETEESRKQQEAAKHHKGQPAEQAKEESKKEGEEEDIDSIIEALKKNESEFSGHLRSIREHASLTERQANELSEAQSNSVRFSALLGRLRDEQQREETENMNDVIAQLRENLAKIDEHLKTANPQTEEEKQALQRALSKQSQASNLVTEIETHSTK